MTECDQGGAIFVTVVRENLSVAEVVSAWRPEGQLPWHWRECRTAGARGLCLPLPESTGFSEGVPFTPRGVSRGP